jgi:hypothetical protein
MGTTQGPSTGRTKALRRFAPLPLALLLLALLAAAAAGAISLPNPVAKPLDTTEAGANTRFETKITLGGTEHIKDLTNELPRGFGADTENPQCSDADFNTEPPACPANTQVADTTVNLSLEPMPGVFVDTPPVTGRVFFLTPAPGGVLPRLGIALDTPTGTQRQIGEASIDNQRGTLKNTIRNFPQDSGGVPIRINSIDVILKKSFAKNPGDCTPATTNFYVTSYENPGVTSTASDTYTPTGCKTPRPPPSSKPRCQGHRATKAGNGRANHITGTSHRDVIFGGGGNDVIKGLKGNDVICGGAGKDKLIGGPGKDVLLGGAGRDTLVGGPGKDRLAGGAGADKQTQ